MEKTAVITGILGQDASYLAEILINDGFNVVGTRRRSSNPNYTNVQHLLNNPKFSIITSDITDPSAVYKLFHDYHIDQFYNLAAQSHVHVSFENPVQTFQSNAESVFNILSAIKDFSPNTKMYQASTSEMFGSNYNEFKGLGPQDKVISVTRFQDENTQFKPESPYAISKVAAHQMCELYRRAYSLYISCGILFNHESPRRGVEFVTRKITDYIGRVVNKKTTDKLKLGNLDAKRDWGFAGDYMRAAYMMLNEDDNPDTYVVSTGVTHSVRDFCNYSFSAVGLDWQQYVETDKSLCRPSEVPYLNGMSTKIRHKLNWSPKVSFEQLVKDMVLHDIERHSRE